MIAVQLFDLDLIRLTFIVGIMTSALLYERTHLTTGSLVVPGYMAAQLFNPAALFITALNSFLTYMVVARILPRYVAIYGRALFIANIFVSILLSLVFEPTLTFGFDRWGLVFDSIGYVIPALIAYDMKRQGPSKTLTSVVGASALAAMPALLIATLFPQWVEPLLPARAGLMAVGDAWFPVAALVSAAVSAAIHANYGLRSGGFIGSMYLGLIAVQPRQLLFVAVVALVTYLAVVHGLGRAMILFGRRKFAVMLVAGSILSWTVLVVADQVTPGWLSINELPIAALFIPALLANDMERTSVVAVFTGGTLAGSLTLSLVVTAAALVDQTALPLWALPLLIVSAGVMAWPKIRDRITLPKFRLWPGRGDPPSDSPPDPSSEISSGGGIWNPIEALFPSPGQLQPIYIDNRDRPLRFDLQPDDPMEPVSWRGPLVRRLP